MARRERRQRLAIDLTSNYDEEPISAEDHANVEEQFSKLIEDIERIKSGPVPSLNHAVLDEVENAPGWVRVFRQISNEKATTKTTPTTAPSHYYWHPATGQLSWAPPTASPDASKSLEMTRGIISDTVERLQAAARAELPRNHVPLQVQKAIQASTLLNLLNSLSKEQQGKSSNNSNSPLEGQMGSDVSAVWCSVHACIAAAVAELSALEEKPHKETEEAVVAAIGVKEEEEIIEKDGDDMDIEEDNGIDPLNEQEAAPVAKNTKKERAAAGQAPPAPFSMITGKTIIKKSKIKSSSRVAGKGASAMMNKWASVQKELKEDLATNVETDDEEEFFDGDAEALAAHKERKRLRQAEEWRIEQIRSGAVDGNSNFAPVMGNWRERMKKIGNEASVTAEEEDEQAKSDFRVQEKKVHKEDEEEVEEKQAAEPTAPTAAAAIPDLDALSVGLPRGWRAMWDVGTSGIYYGNLETQATQWERPS